MRTNSMFWISLAVVWLIASAVPSYAVYHVGDLVADFTLNDSNGNPVSLYDFMGMTVLINFWDTG